jgi:NifB/MoaA-like Fe-S oxidoreductase
VTITNQRLGDTITVAGLLMVHDIIDQLLASTYGDLIILPQVTFDHPDVISLDDLSPQTVANRLGETVVLGDQMGDVWDAWLGQSLLIFHPQ